MKAFIMTMLILMSAQSSFAIGPADREEPEFAARERAHNLASQTENDIKKLEASYKDLAPFQQYKTLDNSRYYRTRGRELCQVNFFGARCF